MKNIFSGEEEYKRRIEISLKPALSPTETALIFFQRKLVFLVLYTNLKGIIVNLFSN